jgi:ABC-type dipeptide/oligopeptide/nickel transport system permease subunit
MVKSRMAVNDQEINELNQGLAEEVSRFTEAWRIFKKNSMALWGLIIFVIFFIVAVSGLILTTGDNPVLDPAKVRLSEKLLKPFTPVNTEMIKPDDRPLFGIYVLGTDDLGRDVFARMMQGAWVSLTVGFIAVGISVLIGIILGGIAGYYGTLKIKFMHVLFFILLFVSMIFFASGRSDLAVNSFLIALLCMVSSFIYYFLLVRGRAASRVFNLLFFDTFTVDTLIMRFVDIMLCFPSFFLILTVVAILPASIYNIMIVNEHNIQAYDSECHCTCPCLCYDRYSSCNTYRGGAEFSGFWRPAASRHMGQYTLGREEIYI